MLLHRLNGYLLPVEYACGKGGFGLGLFKDLLDFNFKIVSICKIYGFFEINFKWFAIGELTCRILRPLIQNTGL
jgi:hypothetical protein